MFLLFFVDFHDIKYPRHLLPLKYILTMGPVNIDGNTGLGNLQRDHRLFLYCNTEPLVILNLEYTGPPVISMWDFNGAKDYFEVLTYRAMNF